MACNIDISSVGPGYPVWGLPRHDRPYGMPCARYKSTIIATMPVHHQFTESHSAHRQASRKTGNAMVRK